jgi:protein-S-isoprenylcysteine O-methyltransferase Ste14
LDEKQLYFKNMLLSFFRFVLTGAAIFAAAGRLNYWQGWVYMTVHLLMFVITIPLFSGKKELFKERFTPGAPAKKWDKIILGVFAALLFTVVLISSIDAGRYQWSFQFPIWFYIAGWTVYLFSVAFSLWAMWVNRFFSSVARIQTDRGHKVVQEGPYKIVRHPGYISMMLLTLVTPVCLGSLYGLIPAAFLIITIFIRTGLEDRMLSEELAGYSDYTKKVRYRLIPWLW